MSSLHLNIICADTSAVVAGVVTWTSPWRHLRPPCRGCMSILHSPKVSLRMISEDFPNSLWHLSFFFNYRNPQKILFINVLICFVNSRWPLNWILICIANPTDLSSSTTKIPKPPYFHQPYMHPLYINDLKWTLVCPLFNRWKFVWCIVLQAGYSSCTVAHLKKKKANAHPLSWMVKIQAWWCDVIKKHSMRSCLAYCSSPFIRHTGPSVWRRLGSCERVCGGRCVCVCVWLSHRITYCDRMGRSKVQQSVVTANNIRAGALWCQWCGVLLCWCVCVFVCTSE